MQTEPLQKYPPLIHRQIKSMGKINACSTKTMSLRSFFYFILLTWTQLLTLILQAWNDRSSFALNTSRVQHHDRIWLPSFSLRCVCMDPSMWKWETCRREGAEIVISIPRLDGSSESIFPDQKHSQSPTPTPSFFILKTATKKILNLTLFVNI